MEVNATVKVNGGETTDIGNLFTLETKDNYSHRQNVHAIAGCTGMVINT